VRLLNHLTLGRLTIDVSACPPFLAQFVGAWVFGCETRLRKLLQQTRARSRHNTEVLHPTAKATSGNIGWGQLAGCGPFSKYLTKPGSCSVVTIDRK
jgi:hypothetical protein